MHSFGVNHRVTTKPGRHVGVTVQHSACWLSLQYTSFTMDFNKEGGGSFGLCHTAIGLKKLGQVHRWIIPESLVCTMLGT